MAVTAGVSGGGSGGAVTQSGAWSVTLLAGSAVVGAVTQSGTWNVTINTALPAGSNSIGTVVLGAGAAAVGTVGVTSLPALPTGANVIGAVTQSGTWNVTVNAALPTGANTIGAVTGSGNFSVVGTKTNNSAAPGATNTGALVAVANAAAQTWTEGNQVALSVDLSGNQRTLIAAALPTGGNVIGAVTQSGTWNVTVNAALPTGANTIGAVTGSGNFSVIGTKSHNGGAPGATNVGTLVAVATAAAPSFTEGNQVGLSVDLSGNKRTIITAALPTGSNVIGAVTQSGTWNVTVNTALPTGTNSIGTVVQGAQNAAGAASWNIQGAGAAAAALAGNPVRIGFSDGTNTRDILRAGAAEGSGDVLPAAMFVKQGTNVYNAVLSSNAAPLDAWNGSQAVSSAMWASGSTGGGAHSWDRFRNNVDVTLLASAARTTTQTSSNITAYNCQAIAVTLDVTAITSTCSLTVTIGYVDPASGKVINLLTSAVIASVSTTMWLVDPRVVAAANLVAQKPIGRVFQITVTVGNANSQTYSVGYTMIPC